MNWQKKERLRHAVDMATGGGLDGQDGWATGLFQITQILHETKGLEMECIALLKKKIKMSTRRPDVSMAGLTILEECMKVVGFSFQHAVIRKVLQRILKIAQPRSPYMPAVRAKAAELIFLWAQEYGTDSRLLEFAGAADELRLQESKTGIRYTPEASVQNRMQIPVATSLYNVQPPPINPDSNSNGAPHHRASYYMAQGHSSPPPHHHGPPHRSEFYQSALRSAEKEQRAAAFRQETPRSGGCVTPGGLGMNGVGNAEGWRDAYGGGWSGPSDRSHQQQSGERKGSSGGGIWGSTRRGDGGGGGSRVEGSVSRAPVDLVCARDTASVLLAMIDEYRETGSKPDVLEDLVDRCKSAQTHLRAEIPTETNEMRMAELIELNELMSSLLALSENVGRFKHGASQTHKPQPNRTYQGSQQPSAPLNLHERTTRNSNFSGNEASPKAGNVRGMVHMLGSSSSPESVNTEHTFGFGGNGVGNPTMPSRQRSDKVLNGTYGKYDRSPLKDLYETSGNGNDGNGTSQDIDLDLSHAVGVIEPAAMDIKARKWQLELGGGLALNQVHEVSDVTGTQGVAVLPPKKFNTGKFESSSPPPAKQDSYYSTSPAKSGRPSWMSDHTDQGSAAIDLVQQAYEAVNRNTEEAESEVRNNSDLNNDAKVRQLELIQRISVEVKRKIRKEKDDNFIALVLQKSLRGMRYLTDLQIVGEIELDSRQGIHM